MHKTGNLYLEIRKKAMTNQDVLLIKTSQLFGGWSPSGFGFRVSSFDIRSFALINSEVNQ